MHNQPDAIDSPETRCPTHPHVGDVTASQRAFHVVEAMNEGQLAVRREGGWTHLCLCGPAAHATKHNGVLAEARGTARHARHGSCVLAVYAASEQILASKHYPWQFWRRFL